ncbi:MAG: hypothetical protein DRR04_13960 [Gammaproteobacteria bacterium]|nr:MAG: hypothetical protein DRR04_13960 [Gammaproteobacteria bacterium]
MKKLMVLLATTLVATTSMAVVNYGNSVHWDGTGDWTDSNWSEWASDTNDVTVWNRPGWVVGNPINTNLSTDVDWNGGYAHIDSGTVNVTPTAKPDGTVSILYMGSNAGSTTMNISGDITVRNKFYMGHESTATDVATINQTAGNVVFGSGNASRTYFGRGDGQSFYNLSGGTLTTVGDWAHFGNSVDSDTSPGTFTFNQTGGTFSDVGTGTSGVGGLLVSDETDAVSFINVSGGTFHADNAVASRMGDNGTATITINGTGAMDSSSALFSLGHYAGATGTMNVSGDGTFDYTGADLRIGRSGTGNVTISENGSFTASGTDTHLGYYTGSEGNVIVDGGTFNANSTTSTRLGNYGSATVTVTGTGVMNSSSEKFMVGTHGRIGSSGTLNVNGNGVVTSSAAEFGVGFYRDTDVDPAGVAGIGIVNVAGSGTLNHSGAVFSVGRSGVGTLNLSEDGDINLTGATVYIGRYYYDGEGGSGTVNMSGGTLTHSGAANTLWVGYDKEGVFNQTGGALEVARLRLADDSRSTGLYSISGGSLKANNFITGGTSGAGIFEVYGSGATSIEAANISFYNDTLRVVLDAGGSTLMVADNSINASYNGQIDIRGVFQLDTTGTFDGTFGDVYNIGWASDVVLTSTMTDFTVLSGTEFEMSILENVDQYGNAGTGQMLQVTVIPEPATLGMLAFVGGAMLWVRRKFMI